MRLRYLDLIRYGKFSDHRIDFPAPGDSEKPDFHLIVGANEAGKSTIRNAITDLLFDFHPRSRFGFLHGLRDLRLGTEIESDGTRLEFHRLKRNKQALRRPDDTSLADDALAAFTGNADRISFEREFCLDHTRLAEGGKSILDAKDDVGRMLFEASAGVGVFGDFLEQLEEEALGLWSPRHSKDREYYKALDAFTAAKKAVKDATARTKAWLDANKKVAEATEKLAAANEEHASLEQTRTRLERIRRVAPHFQARNAKIKQCADFRDTIILPEDAAENLATVRKHLAEADRAIVEYQTLIEKAIKDQEGISLNEELLARKDDINALKEEKSRIKNHPVDIAKREAETLILSGDIEYLVHNLGWKMSDDKVLEKALPTEILRKDIEILANSFGGLDQLVTGTGEAVHKQQKDIARFSTELEKLSNRRSSPEINTALANARKLGDTEDAKAEFKTRIERATRRLETGLAKMHPWAGSMQDLQQLSVPGDEEVLEFKNKQHDIWTWLNNAREQFQETDNDLKKLALKESRFQQERQPLTFETIVSARENRDEMWLKIRTGTEDIAQSGDDYEAQVATADELADRRYQNADETRRLEHLQDEIAQLMQRRQIQEEKIRDLEVQHQSLIDKWHQAVGKLGLGDLGISGFQTWLGYYKAALEDAEVLRDAEAGLCRLEARGNTAAKALGQALLQCGIDEDTNLTLLQLIEKANLVAQEIEVSGAKREQLSEQIRRRQNDLEDLEHSEVKARIELADWNTSWAEKTRSAGFPDKITPKTAGTALGLMSELREKLREKRDRQQTRIKTMRRDIKRFEQGSMVLAKTIAPDLENRPAVDIAIVLSNRLNEAEIAQTVLIKARQEVKENTRRSDQAKILKTRSETRLAPLMKLAGIETIAELETAIERSQHLRKLNRDIDNAAKIILEQGDGLSMQALEEEITGEDLAAIEALLGEIKKQSALSTEHRDECLLQKKVAEEERAAMHGQADAATAEANRQQALALMAGVTERFIKVRIGASLLRWAIERYRDEKRGPLLEQASKIFSILTLGSFENLEIDYDGDTPQLMGRRPDQKLVDFEGLSEGTGDQLYLSLRLAAVEMQLQHTQPLPFIADDLFVNYSDDRAIPGFKALGDLATKSQVIYFTHHDHLIDIARKAIGKELNVIHI